MVQYNVDFNYSGLGQLNKALGTMNTNAEQGTKALEKQKQATQNLAGEFHSMSSGINVLGFSMNTLLDTMIAFDGKGQGIGKGIAGFSEGFNTASESGLGFIDSIGKGFKGLTASTMTLKGVLMTSFLPLTAAIGIIYTLKKVWDNNIGGIQTRFQEVMGKIQTAWAKFEVAFVDVLRTIEPVISYFFDQIFIYFGALFKLGQSLFKGLYSAVEPIIDVFKDIFAIFSSGEGDMNSMIGPLDILVFTFKVFGGILEILGKTIGFVLKIALFPLSKAIEFASNKVGDVIDMWKNLIASFKETSVFKGVMSIFDSLANIFERIINLVNKIPGVNIPTDMVDKAQNQISGGSRGSGQVKNSNYNINVNTSREISSNGAKDFSSVLARDLDK